VGRASLTCAGPDWASTHDGGAHPYMPLLCSSSVTLLSWHLLLTLPGLCAQTARAGTSRKQNSSKHIFESQAQPLLPNLLDLHTKSSHTFVVHISPVQQAKLAPLRCCCVGITGLDSHGLAVSGVCCLGGVFRKRAADLYALKFGAHQTCCSAGAPGGPG